MLKKTILLGALSTCMYGCQSAYIVQYDSAPQSAMVICGYEQKGFTPLQLNYSKEEAKKGYLRTIPCKASWVSGAEANFNSDFDTTQFPKGVRTFAQSPNTDGRDIQFDYQRKQAQSQANAQAWRDLNESLQQNKQKTTYCNQIGFQTVCNTY